MPVQPTIRRAAGRLLRRLCPCALAWACVAQAALAQDMAVTALLQPQSGCGLPAAQTIRIRSTNYGATLPGASIFSYGYTINGGPEVSETVFMGNPVPPNGTITYNFINPADLSQPGTYLIDARITVSNDTNPANNALGAQAIVNWAATQGGAVPSPAGTTTAGTLTLAGQLGSVLEWQQSTDGMRWRSLENTTGQQAFAGLTQVTRFRVRVQNGPCPDALSESARVSPETIFANGFEP